MAKKTIKIERQSIKESAKVTVNENTVKLDYDYTSGQFPDTVNFSVFRGVEGTANFTGQQALGGTLQQNGNFSSFNLGQRHQGDGALFDEIYTICEAILQGTIKKITEDENAD